MLNTSRYTAFPPVNRPWKVDDTRYRTGWSVTPAIASRTSRAIASEPSASTTTTPSLVTMMPLLNVDDTPGVSSVCR